MDTSGFGSIGKSSSGAGAVTTVAGRTGDVVLSELDIASLIADLAAKAPLNNPTFTGTVTLPSGIIIPSSAVGTTQTALDNSTKFATTAYADAAVGVETTRATAAEALKATLAGTVGGPPKVIRRTSTSSTISSNNTPANDDTLLWAIGATDVWYFIARLIFVAADSSGLSTTEDLLLGWSVPTGATMLWGADGAGSNNVNGYGAAAVANTPGVLKTQTGTQAFGMAAGNIGVGLSGLVVADGTHTGNVNLQWSQNTSNAATLAAGINSFIIAWRAV